MASGRTIESTGSLVEEENFARIREIGRNGVGKIVCKSVSDFDLAAASGRIERCEIAPQGVDRNCGAGAGCGKGESSVREILNRERSRN